MERDEEDEEKGVFLPVDEEGNEFVEPLSARAKREEDQRQGEGQGEGKSRKEYGERERGSEKKERICENEVKREDGSQTDIPEYKSLNV